MPRSAPDPAAVKAALELVASGCSTRDVARVANVSAVTVSRWVKKYGTPELPSGVPVSDPPPVEEAPVPEVPEDPPPAADSDPAVPEDPIDTDTLSSLRRMHHDMLRTSRDARRVGNYTAAQRSMRDAAALANTITRAEKDAKAAGDSLSISKDELDVARTRVRETAQAILERPLLCAHCSRALSASWGESESDSGSGGAGDQ